MPDTNANPKSTPLPRSTIRPVLRPSSKHTSPSLVAVSARASSRPPPSQRPTVPAAAQPVGPSVWGRVGAVLLPSDRAYDLPFVLAAGFAALAIVSAERIGGTYGVAACLGVLGFFAASLWIGDVGRKLRDRSK